MPPPLPRPSRLLIVLPSWIGDTVMATPTLRALRRALPGAFIGGLMRPGLEGLLGGTDFFDEVHLDRASGMMGPKRVAAKVRVRRYDAAILLTNSFSTALTTRLAGIPRRLGYDRDARGLLLTERLVAPRRREIAPYNRSKTAPNDWAPIPACEYYFALARRFLELLGLDAGAMDAMELRVTEAERAAAEGVLSRLPALRSPPPALAFLNPGGNDPKKRWPAERFAELADWLIERRGMTVLISGSPAESDLTARIASMIPATRRERAVDLASVGAGSPIPGLPPLSFLKAVIARCSIMVTNDTGPRHIAAALGVPVVTLFGPTDHRWTSIPFDRETIVLADPTLPDEEVANDHPERCAIERVEVASVIAAIESRFSASG
ncbi:MAG: lipopolysaccharide heptosyltransferase II [Phycisphaerae bacterium]|nr:lipopolysaccharide heptosyltransferase II [Phycisphaerae bacterium]